MAPHPTVASSSSALAQLAETLTSLSYATVGDTTNACARQRLFDTLGATLIGLQTPEGQLLRRYVEQLQTLGQEPAAPQLCPWYVGATRTTEIDDIDIASCTTVGSVVVPVALTVAAAQPTLDGRALLAGLVAGYEAMIRLGRAIGGAALLYRGVWPTYVTAAFGAAATTAKLLGLDAQQTAAALALAVTRSAGLPPRALAPHGFRYYALGCAAAEGTAAAVAAAAGVDADLECVAAFAERIGADLDAAELTDGLGDQWRIRAVDTKMFPSSRQALASIEAFMRQTPLTGAIEEIDAIVVAVPAQYRNMVDRPALPSQRIDSMIGVQYAMALAALNPDALYDAVRGSLRSDADTAALMAKIVVQADPELSARFPYTWGSKVTVRWRSGHATAVEVLEPSGSGRGELGWAAIERKLERIFAASGLGRPERIARLAERCEAVGRRSDAGVGIALLEEISR